MTLDKPPRRDQPTGTLLKKDSPANPCTQSDTAWKRVLDRWFRPFLECFWPACAKKIDWDAPIEELSQEMLSFTPDSLVGKQLVDKLYKIQTKTKQSYVILTHVEIQGDKEDNFSRRLFEYCYKIYDRYQLPILTLVVLSDDHPRWHPRPFEMEVLGYTTLRYNFQSVKLLDWKGQEKQLLASRNPFENLIAIYLESRRTRHAPAARLKTKVGIFKQLLRERWERDDMLSFATFLSGVMRLPEALELKYHNEVIELEKDMSVNYLTSAEYFGHRAGLEEGIQQGMQQGIQQGLEQGSYQAHRATAKNMILAGWDVSTIHNMIGLPEIEIERLKEELL